MNKKRIIKCLFVLTLVGVMCVFIVQGTSTALASDSTLVEVAKTLFSEDFNDITDITSLWDDHSGNTGSGSGVYTQDVAIDDNAMQLVGNNVPSWVEKEIPEADLDNIILEYQYRVNRDGNVSVYLGDADATTTDVSTPNLMPNTATVGTWYDVRVVLQKNDTEWSATLYQKSGVEWASIDTATVIADTNDSIHLCFLTMTEALIDNVRFYTIETYTDGMCGIYTAPTIRDGASVRLVEGESGIRFSGDVNKEYVDSTLANTDGVASVQYGIMITPKAYLNEECSGFTVAGLSEKYAENPYLKIEAIKKIAHEDSYEFRCAMIGLTNYGTEFVARSYIEILGTDGSVTHVYSDFTEEHNVRSIKEVAKAALSDTSTSYADTERAILQDYAAVYVASTGSDDSDGTASAPYATLKKALEEAANKGIIVINDNYTLPVDFTWPKSDKQVTIEGATSSVTLDFSAAKDNMININSPTTFDNITFSFKSDASVFANGNALKIENTVISSTPITLYGGSNGGTIDSTDITVLAGNYIQVYGGGRNATVTKTTKVTVGGNINSDLCDTFDEGTYHIYGGGSGGSVGETYVYLEDGARARYVYGGSSGSSAKVDKTHVMIYGGTVMSVCGGNASSSTINEINVTVTGGKMEQLFGANQNASMTGKVVVDLQGGEITRRVYGGCYNEYKPLKWVTQYYVTGTIELKLSKDVKISRTGKDFAGKSCDDLSIYACSRYNKNFADEQCTITFADRDAYNQYNGKLGATDWVMKLLMINAKAYDEWKVADSE